MAWTQFADFVGAIPGDAYAAEDGWGMHKAWDDIMSFQPPGRLHGRVDFVQYRQALHEAGYYARQTNHGLLASLSQGLFGHPAALTDSCHVTATA